MVYSMNEQSEKKTNEPWYRKSRNKWKSLSRLKRYSIITTILLLIYTITGFFIIPAVGRKVAQTELSERLGRKVTIERVQFNPYTFILRVYNFKIEGIENRDEFFSLKQLTVNLESSSIFKLALVVNEVTVDTPVVSITRKSFKEFNFDDIVQRLLEGVSEEIVEEISELDEEKETGQFEFSINNIVLKNAQVYVKDQFTQKSHALTNVNLAIPFISNFEYRIEEYVTPFLSGNLNGAEFKFKGQSKPFKHSHETSLNIFVENVNLAHFDEYKPQFVKGKLHKCRFDSNLAISFKLSEDKAPELNFDGGFSLSDIDITLDDETVFSLKKFRISITPSNLFEMKLHLKEVLISEPFIKADRLKDGSFNWQSAIDLEKIPKKEVVEDSEENNTEPEEAVELRLADFIDLTIDEIKMEDGYVSFSDLTNDVPFSTTITPMNLSIKSISTTAESPSTMEFDLKASNGEQVNIKSEFTLPGLNATTDVKITGINPPAYSPYYQKFLNAKLTSGKVDVEANASASMDNLVLNSSKVSLHDFLLQTTEQKDIISLPKIEVITESFDLNKSLLVVESIKLTNGGQTIVRNQDNSINLQSIVNLDALPKTMPSTPEPESSKSNDSLNKFTVLLKQFEVENYGISFEDLATEQYAETLLYPIGLKLSDISSDLNSEIKFDFSTEVNQAGLITSTGILNPAEQTVKTSVKVDKLSLPKFQSYISEFTNVVLDSGEFSTESDINIDASNLKEPLVKLSSTSSVDNFKISGKRDKKHFIGWESVKVENLNATNKPLSASIDKFHLKGQYGAIIKGEDGTLNISHIIKENAEGTQPEETASSETETASTPKLKLPELTIKEILIEESSFKYIDQSISPFYEANLKDIRLEIGKISTQSTEKADIKLNVAIDHHTELKLNGKIDPLNITPFADVAIKISDIELSSLTPYSGKYIGYEIAKGKLQLDLNYKVENNKINATNDVLLDKLTFGESVESDDATSLPVKFALSIITDKNDQVKLNVPISGDLTDPNFSVGGAIVTVLKNIFTKVVTSPFSFIASMYGATEELKTVEFEVGSEALSEAEVEKLATLIEMMQDRPGIRIDVKGYADPEKDREKILADRFELFLKTAMYNDLWESEQEETTVEEMVINWDDQEEYEEILEEAYDESEFDKEENFLGIVKSQPVDVMEKMIKNHLEVTDNDLRELALNRTKVVSGHLKDVGKIEPSRMFLVEPDNQEVENKTSVSIDIK